MIRSLAPAVTIIIVTHNLGQARRISDRTIFFYQGKLVEFDETPKLFEDPKEPETARYVTGRMG
jgi:phosphate transport system ATP-binding protein